jgi:hypothetical protein
LHHSIILVFLLQYICWRVLLVVPKKRPKFCNLVPRLVELTTKFSVYIICFLGILKIAQELGQLRIYEWWFISIAQNYLFWWNGEIRTLLILYRHRRREVVMHFGDSLSIVDMIDSKKVYHGPVLKSPTIWIDHLFQFLFYADPERKLWKIQIPLDLELHKEAL